MLLFYVFEIEINRFIVFGSWVAPQADPARPNHYAYQPAPGIWELKYSKTPPIIWVPPI